MKFFHFVAAAMAVSGANAHSFKPKDMKLHGRDLAPEDMSYDPETTAIVIVDPQNDFLHPEGVAYWAVGASVEENDTVNNIGKLFVAARDLGYQVFVSPHWYYPYDDEWQIGGVLETVMHDIDMFTRTAPLSLENFEGSGADFLDVYKPYIENGGGSNGNVIVTSPHKVYGPEQNDLALQLRKRKYDRVILAGMSSNLCVEAHMRELTEEGFEVSVVSDATAGGRVDGLGDGYESAMINFRFIASAVMPTMDTLSAMGMSDPGAVVFPEPGNVDPNNRNLLAPIRKSIENMKKGLKAPAQPMTNNILQDLERKYEEAQTGRDANGRRLQTPTFDPATTAVVVIDPQNDFLSPNGVTWGLVGPSVEQQNTVANIGRLFKAADEQGYLTFISPHWYYPYDHKWEFGGTLEKVMHAIGMFDRADPLSLEGFEGSGADWLGPYKPYIAKDNVIVTSPHKIYGPEQNDLALQMRKRKIDRVILIGMSSNLCVEAHLRELIEKGFEVNVVSDGTAGGDVPDLGDGYEAALINFRYMATSVLTTDEALSGMGVADPSSVTFEYDEADVACCIPEPESRLALQFKGQSTLLGTLTDINTMYNFATPITTEMAFGAEMAAILDADDSASHLGCFESPMLNPEDEIQVGRGIDCLWGITGGVAAIAFFDFQEEGCEDSLMVHAGTTTIGSFADGVGIGPVAKDGPPVDTISGSASGLTIGAKTILADVGQGAFEGITGSVRLSGALNMGAGETPFFNCIWEISMDMIPSCGLHDDDSTSHFLTDASMIEAAKEPIDTGNIEESDEVSVTQEEAVYETVGHAWVKFHGEATHLGGLAEASEFAGLETPVTLEDCFSDEDQALIGDELGCHAVDLKDLLSDEVIGTGIDCLWAIEGGVAAVGWYITEHGVIVNSGLTSLVPFADGVGQGSVTGLGGHPDGAVMSASFPPEYDADTFVLTTGLYEDIKGNIRLSGIATPGEPFYFNCVWDIMMVITPENIEEISSGEPESAAFAIGFSSAVAAVLASTAYLLV